MRKMILDPHGSYDNSTLMHSILEWERLLGY